MLGFDLKSNIKPLNGLNTQVISSDTTTAGEVIDTAAYHSLVAVLKTGVVTSGDVQLIIEESDVAGSGFVAVASDYLDGTLLSTNISASNGISIIGINATKRYVKISVLTANSANLTVGCSVLLGTPNIIPTV